MSPFGISHPSGMQQGPVQAPNQVPTNQFPHFQGVNQQFYGQNYNAFQPQFPQPNHTGPPSMYPSVNVQQSQYPYQPFGSQNSQWTPGFNQSGYQQVPGGNPCAPTGSMYPSQYFQHQAPTANSASTLDLKKFSVKDHYPLTSYKGIQSWYNRFQKYATSRNCFVTEWRHVTKNKIMGSMWDHYVPVEVKKNYNVMQAAIHSFLSHPDTFGGECAHFCLITETTSDGYEALYNILRHAHPALGQVRKQAKQPIHKKSQEFLLYIGEYINYFQSELCENRPYDDNARVICILDNIHPYYQSTLKRRYLQLVPQGVPLGIFPFRVYPHHVGCYLHSVV